MLILTGLKKYTDVALAQQWSWKSRFNSDTGLKFNTVSDTELVMSIWKMHMKDYISP